LNGERHRGRRRMVMPMFTKTAVERYRDTMAAEIERRLERFRPGVETDVAREMTDLTLASVLSLLIRARDDDDAAMTDIELVGQVTVFFVAGFETTANTLAWTLFLLSQHPKELDELVEELDQVLGGRIPSSSEPPARSCSSARSSPIATPRAIRAERIPARALAVARPRALRIPAVRCHVCASAPASRRRRFGSYPRRHPPARPAGLRAGAILDGGPQVACDGRKHHETRRPPSRDAGRTQTHASSV
jgi:cytochrome P450